jgi:hypothetical protein
MYSSTLSLTSALDEGWVINATPWLLYPPVKDPVPIVIGGWVRPRADLDGCGKSRQPPSTGIRLPDRRARSESLYRLSYSGVIVDAQ